MDQWAHLTVWTPMTAVEWGQLQAILTAMRPALVEHSTEADGTQERGEVRDGE